MIELRKEVSRLKAEKEKTSISSETPKSQPDKEYLDAILKEYKEDKDISNYIQDINSQLLTTGFTSIHSLDGKYVYLGNDFEKLTGYKAANVLGKAPFSLMHLEDQRKQKNLILPQNLKGKATVTNWRLKHKQGYFLWLETYSHIILDKEQKPAYIYCLSTDVSDKMIVQNKMSRTQKMYNSIFQSSPDALFLLDIHTFEIYDCNKRALKLFKYNSKNELFGKHFSELQFKELTFTDIHLINRRINNKKIWTAEVKCVDSNGNFFDGMMGMQKGENPDAPFILLRITDLTKIKKSQTLIHEQEQLISSISENVNEGIYRSKLSGKLIYVNKAFAKIFGYDNIDEVMKLNAAQLYAHAAQREEITSKIHKLGILNNEEALFLHKKGYQFWGLLNCKLSRGEKGEFYFDGAIKDITESKNYQNRLELQNEELIEVNNALDRFVYSASHDLRAPIASSLGLIEIALKEDNINTIKKYLTLKNKSLKKLDNFISDIIDYSRNTRLDISYEEINLQMMIENAFETYNYIENSSLIQKEINIAIDEEFYSDKMRLNIIFNNLLSNAIKYANLYNNRPEIIVEIEVNNREAIIEIRDNGLGISAKHLNKIFDMFYRAHPDKKGSGLGLFIVQEAVQKLKGSIQVSSTENKGSTFILTLPNMVTTQTHNLT